MKTLEQLNAVQTLDDLEDLGIGPIDAEMSYRGGGLGFYGGDVAEHFEVDDHLLPHKFGAGCNYLGGGVRGAIFASNFSQFVPEDKSILLRALADACIRVYQNLEEEEHMNDEVDEDGETNWEAKCTKASREAGIQSAY